MRNTTNSRIRNGSIFMFTVGWFMVAMAIMWIFWTEIFVVSDFLAYTGTTYADYLISSPRFAEFWLLTKKLIGIFLLATGITIVFITHNGYKKGERWSWYALLIAGNVPWWTFIIYKIYIGYYGGSMVVFVIGAILCAIGLAIPAKEFIGKKSS